MKIEYLPNIGFQILTEKFTWNENRKALREKLNQQHKEDDRTIEIAKFFDNNSEHQDIKQSRDIYENIDLTKKYFFQKKAKNYFFLNYNEDNKLQSIEIHGGIDVKIKNFTLEFKKDITIALKSLSAISENYSEVEDGNYVIEDLKMAIATSESMGGDGNGLDYFYASNDIEHMIDKD